jgi:hypothetical protein
MREAAGEPSARRRRSMPMTCAASSARASCATAPPTPPDTPTITTSSPFAARLGLRDSAGPGMAISSAWLPSKVKPVPHTSGLDAPEKSRPGTRGSTVRSICPSTFLTSLGFTDAARIRTTAQPRRGWGVGPCAADCAPVGVDATGAMLILLALAKVRSSLHLCSFEEKRRWRGLLASTFLIKSGSRSG